MPDKLKIFSRTREGEDVEHRVEARDVQRVAGRLIGRGHTDLLVGETKADALPLAVWQVATGAAGIREF